MDIKLTYVKLRSVHTYRLRPFCVTTEHKRNAADGSVSLAEALVVSLPHPGRMEKCA